jgi:hypothetical protein
MRIIVSLIFFLLFDRKHCTDPFRAKLCCMSDTRNVYDGLKVTEASLLSLDRFHLVFSDGTKVDLTLRQVQAIRQIRLTGTPLRGLPRRDVLTGIAEDPSGVNGDLKQMLHATGENR